MLVQLVVVFFFLAVSACGQVCTDVIYGHLALCSVRQDGTVWCSGKNNYGQLGNGFNTSEYDPEDTTTVQAIGVTDVVSLHSDPASSRFIGIRSDGSLVGWGKNQYKELLADDELVNTPVPVWNFTNVVDVAIGSLHTCVLTTESDVYCWGRQDLGTLGDGYYSPSASAPIRDIPYHATTGLREIESNAFSTCGRTMSGALRCW